MNKFEQGDIIIYKNIRNSIYFIDEVTHTKYRIQMLLNNNVINSWWMSKEKIEQDNIIYTTIFRGVSE